VPIQCVATADESVGATCTADTSLDAVVPGLVQEGSRAIWELGGLAVSDGGADGDVDTNDNEVFAKQGVLVP
jgi:hypothetical protein